MTMSNLHLTVALMFTLFTFLIKVHRQNYIIKYMSIFREQKSTFYEYTIRGHFTCFNKNKDFHFLLGILKLFTFLLTKTPQIFC